MILKELKFSRENEGVLRQSKILALTSFAHNASIPPGVPDEAIHTITVDTPVASGFRELKMPSEPLINVFTVAPSLWRRLLTMLQYLRVSQARQSTRSQLMLQRRGLT